jgi:membrane protease YdiL (CAAX protease family)
LTARAFFFTATGGLRAPWRIAVFLVATMVVALVLQSVAYPILVALAEPLGLRVRAFAWIEALSLLGGTAIALRRVDRRPWSDVYLGREAAAFGRIARGTLLGALAIGVPSALLLASGWLRIEPAADGSWWTQAGRLALLLAPAALAEELLVRGYVFAVLRDAWGWPWTLTATSLVFGLLHIWNPGSDVQPTVMVTLAGVFLGIVLLTLRSLYAAWAAHFAWNWVMAAGYHVAVSGIAMETADYRVVDAGPDWATGGSWGPEAGLGAALGMMAGMAYLAVPVWRRIFGARHRTHGES